jgi:gliding motility-associated-like protein
VKTAGSFTVQVTDTTTCLSNPSAATDVALHPVPPAPTITPGGTTSICEYDSVLLDASAGSAWLWSNGQTTRSINAKSAGDYTVQVSNAEGCWSPLSTPSTITVKPAPSKPLISFAGSTELCQGDSLVLNSSTGDSYSWSSGETTASITVNTSGSWWVRVADTSGCYSIESDPVATNVNPLPEKPVISGANEYCAGDSVELSAPAATTWLWSTGAITATIYVASGTYTLTVGNASGCVSPASDPHAVTENPLPAEPVISGDTLYCPGDSTTLTSSPAESWLWSTGATTPATKVTAGSYTVRVFDEKGCSNESPSPVTVTQLPKPGKPTITADGPLEFWLGDSVILSSSTAAAYLWSPGAETTKDITIKTAGDYSVTVTDMNGCTSDASDPVTVTVLTLEKPVITLTGDSVFCEEAGQALLSTSDAFAYLWSTGDTTKSISVTASGSYTVRVFNDAGLPSEISDPLNVTVHANPSASLAGKSDVACHGESTGTAEVSATGGTGPYTYQWSGGQTGALAMGLQAGIHTATILDANQCQDTVNVTITQPEAIQIREEITHPYCDDSNDGSIEISISGGTPGYSILWSDGSPDILLENLGPGIVDVTVTDAGQCMANASYTLSSSESTCITVYEIITPNNDGYNDTWRIRGIEFYPEATVEIYDRWGKQVFYSKGYDREWDGIYNGELLPMASYHYVIKLNNGSPALVGNITIVK